MSFQQTSYSGLGGAKPKGTHSYINADGDLVEEGGDFLGARTAGGEAFADEEESGHYSSGHEYYQHSAPKEKKSKKSKHHSESKRKDSVPRAQASSGGCCGGCQHGHQQQPVQQQYPPQLMQQHYGHPGMTGPAQGNGYAAYPQGAHPPQGYGRSFQ